MRNPIRVSTVRWQLAAFGIPLRARVRYVGRHQTAVTS